MRSFSTLTLVGYSDKMNTLSGLVGAFSKKTSSLRRPCLILCQARLSLARRALVKSAA